MNQQQILIEYNSNNTDNKNIEMMHTPQVPSNSESPINTDRIQFKQYR